MQGQRLVDDRVVGGEIKRMVLHATCNILPNFADCTFMAENVFHRIIIFLKKKVFYIIWCGKQVPNSSFVNEDEDEDELFV